MHLPQALPPPQKALSWGAAGAAEGRGRRSLSRRVGKPGSMTFVSFPPLFLPFPPKKSPLFFELRGDFFAFSAKNFLKIFPLKTAFLWGHFLCRYGILHTEELHLWRKRLYTMHNSRPGGARLPGLHRMARAAKHNMPPKNRGDKERSTP